MSINPKLLYKFTTLFILFYSNHAITNNPLFDFNPNEYSYYVIVPSSCSIQPNKYKQVLLARLKPIENIDGSMKSAFLETIKCTINFKIF